MPLRARRRAVITVLILAGLGTACRGDGNDPPDDDVEAQVRSAVQLPFQRVPQVLDAVARLVAALQGSPAEGVNLTETAEGYTGTVGIDFDGNGSMEATVSGHFEFNDVGQGLAGGGVVSVTDIAGVRVDGAGALALAPSGVTSVQVGPGSALLTVEGEPDPIQVPQVGFNIDYGSPEPIVDGSLSFTIGEVSGAMYFESDGAGGWRMRVTGDDFEFTLP